MTNNIKTGQIGESLACRHLLDKKYKIIDRNYRETWGELDIICKSQCGVLVFVEVKTMRAQPDLKMFHTDVKHSNIDHELKPEDNLSWSKLEKVKRTAYLYANSHTELVDDKKGWRIDLIAIEINHLNPESLNQNDLFKYSTIRHYEGIVE